jgi:DNA polymerase III delta subunit
METKVDRAVSNYINGNISDWTAAVKQMSKLDILDLIESAAGTGIPRHQIINIIRQALER